MDKLIKILSFLLGLSFLWAFTSNVEASHIMRFMTLVIGIIWMILGSKKDN